MTEDRCSRTTMTLLLLLLFETANAMRCYITADLNTKPVSVECGIHSGCLKVYIDSEEMLMRIRRQSGYIPGFGEVPELPERFENNPVVFRGCFVLKVPDRCYNAEDGYSYCWCSSKDLCNGSTQFTIKPLLLLLLVVLAPL